MGANISREDEYEGTFLKVNEFERENSIHNSEENDRLFSEAYKSFNQYNTDSAVK